MIMYIITEIRKILIHIIVRVSQNQNPEALHVGVPFPILFGMFRLKMLRAIQLNDDLCFRNIEVCNIFADYFLPMNGQWQELKVVIPKVILFLCHSFPQ